jgi:hypothetical protein
MTRPGRCASLGTLRYLALSATTIDIAVDQPTIQDWMFASAPGDTLLVAVGTFTGPGNQDIHCLSRKGSSDESFSKTLGYQHHCGAECRCG